MNCGLKKADPETHSFLGENEKRMNKVAIPLKMEGENKEYSLFSSVKFWSRKKRSQAKLKFLLLITITYLLTLYRFTAKNGDT